MGFSTSVVTQDRTNALAWGTMVCSLAAIVVLAIAFNKGKN